MEFVILLNGILLGMAIGIKTIDWIDKNAEKKEKKKWTKLPHLNHDFLAQEARKDMFRNWKLDDRITRDERIAFSPYDHTIKYLENKERRLSIELQKLKRIKQLELNVESINKDITEITKEDNDKAHNELLKEVEQKNKSLAQFGISLNDFKTPVLHQKEIEKIIKAGRGDIYD